MDFPLAKFENGEVVFEDGEAIKLPIEYLKDSNREVLHSFYSKLLNEKNENPQNGEDPLGFTFIQFDYLCIVGVVCVCQKRSTYNRLRKKYPQNVFNLNYLKFRILESHKLENYQEFIPIKVVSQNLHEIRGLNAKVTSHVDDLLKFEDERSWEETFDNADPNLKKIFVASRLTKFILDNTKFYDPKFWDHLEFSKGRYFNIHGSVSKIVKIYKNDFKIDKPDLEFTGHCHRKLEGDKEYFEILIKILVENAYKYSPYKKLGPKIKIIQMGSKVLIEAHSYGQIIPEEDRKHIFSKGFRSSVNKGKAEGTGMGLYNAARLAEKFGGKIQYSDKESGAANPSLGWNIFSLIFQITYDKNKDSFN